MCKRFRGKNTLRLLLLPVLLFSFTHCSKEAPKSENVATEMAEMPELSVFQLPAEWVNQNGKEVQLSDFRGKKSVFVMIYTSCQAACPRLVADMRDIADKIPPNVKDEVNLVLVSIDPEVDTPERAAAFMKENELTESYWHFLSGSEENTREFAMVLGVRFKQISPIDFSHSNIISLFDEQGLLVYQQIGLGVSNDPLLNELKKM